jgi:hypothetical protein
VLAATSATGISSRSLLFPQDTRSVAVREVSPVEARKGMRA